MPLVRDQAAAKDKLVIGILIAIKDIRYLYACSSEFIKSPSLNNLYLRYN